MKIYLFFISDLFDKYWLLIRVVANFGVKPMMAQLTGGYMPHSASISYMFIPYR